MMNEDELGELFTGPDPGTAYDPRPPGAVATDPSLLPDINSTIHHFKFLHSPGAARFRRTSNHH